MFTRCMWCIRNGTFPMKMRTYELLARSWILHVHREIPNATRFPTAIRIYFAVYLSSAIRYHLESIGVTIKSVLVQYFAPYGCINTLINLYETILTWLRKICFSRTSRKCLPYNDILSPLRESSATLIRIKFSSDVKIYFVIYLSIFIFDI